MRILHQDNLSLFHKKPDMTCPHMTLVLLLALYHIVMSGYILDTLHLGSKVCLMGSRAHLNIVNTCWFLYCKASLHCNVNPRYIVHK